MARDPLFHPIYTASHPLYEFWPWRLRHVIPKSRQHCSRPHSVKAQEFNGSKQLTPWQTNLSKQQSVNYDFSVCSSVISYILST
jgi:hypothetical protein